MLKRRADVDWIKDSRRLKWPSQNNIWVPQDDQRGDFPDFTFLGTTPDKNILLSRCEHPLVVAAVIEAWLESNNEARPELSVTGSFDDCLALSDAGHSWLLVNTSAAILNNNSSRTVTVFAIATRTNSEDDRVWFYYSENDATSLIQSLEREGLVKVAALEPWVPTHLWLWEWLAQAFVKAVQDVSEPQLRFAGYTIAALRPLRRKKSRFENAAQACD